MKDESRSDQPDMTAPSDPSETAALLASAALAHIEEWAEKTTAQAEAVVAAWNEMAQQLARAAGAIAPILAEFGRAAEEAERVAGFLPRAAAAAAGTELDVHWLAGYYAWREERGLDDCIPTLVFGFAGPASPWWGALRLPAETGGGG